MRFNPFAIRFAAIRRRAAQANCLCLTPEVQTMRAIALNRFPDSAFVALNILGACTYLARSRMGERSATHRCLNPNTVRYLNISTLPHNGLQL
jgi:hypothetical protein